MFRSLSIFEPQAFELILMLLFLGFHPSSRPTFLNNIFCSTLFFPVWYFRFCCRCFYFEKYFSHFFLWFIFFCFALLCFPVTLSNLFDFHFHSTFFIHVCYFGSYDRFFCFKRRFIFTPFTLESSVDVFLSVASLSICCLCSAVFTSMRVLWLQVFEFDVRLHCLGIVWFCFALKCEKAWRVCLFRRLFLKGVNPERDESHLKFCRDLRFSRSIKIVLSFPISKIKYFSSPFFSL